MALPDGLSQEILDRIQERFQRDIEQRFHMSCRNRPFPQRPSLRIDSDDATAIFEIFRRDFDEARRAGGALAEITGDGTGEALPAIKPCHNCANYVGRTMPGGSLRGELCCAMHPSGPDADECPDWEDRNSPDAQRRRLKERHTQQRAELEARQRKESERLEAKLNLQSIESPSLTEVRTAVQTTLEDGVLVHREVYIQLNDTRGMP